MPVIQPVLGGITLPRVSEYSEAIGYRGAPAIMADGSAQFEVTNTNQKRVFSLTWNGITTAQKTTITTAYDTVRDSTASFTLPVHTGSPVIVNVTRSEQQDKLDFKAISIPNEVLWQVTMLLREV